MLQLATLPLVKTPTPTPNSNPNQNIPEIKNSVYLIYTVINNIYNISFPLTTSGTIWVETSLHKQFPFLYKIIAYFISASKYVL